MAFFMLGHPSEIQVSSGLSEPSPGGKRVFVGRYLEALPVPTALGQAQPANLFTAHAATPHLATYQSYAGYSFFVPSLHTALCAFHTWTAPQSSRTAL